MIELRILSADDSATAVVHDRLTPRYDVLEETRRPDDFLWAVIADGESVIAAHRALIGHGRLYLRGVFTFQNTGFATAYTLARYLLGEARRRGIHRSHLWVETAGRERSIAELLGARTDPTPLHRFRVPASPQAVSGLRGTSGTLDFSGAPLLDWLVDRATTILFGPSGPDGRPGPVPFGEAIDLPWDELVATPFIELPVPASDIPATFDLLTRGARRMSRYSVLHGDVAPETP